MDSLKTQVSSMTLNETKSWEEAGSDSRQDMGKTYLNFLYIVDDLLDLFQQYVTDLLPISF